MHFLVVKKSRKRYGFVIFSYLKDRLSVFTAIKRDAKFETRYEKGVPSVNRMYTKGVTFLCKKVYKRVMGWTPGRSLPPFKTFWISPLPLARVLFLDNRIMNEVLITNLFET